MHRRRASGPSISFFAFQDIITSVVGIFVLILLIMSIELVSRTMQGGNRIEQIEDTVSASITALERILVEMRQTASKLTSRAADTATVNRFNFDEIRDEIQHGIAFTEEQQQRADNTNSQLRGAIKSMERKLASLNQEAASSEAKQAEIKQLRDKQQSVEAKILELSTDDSLIFREGSIQGKDLVMVDIRSNKIDVMKPGSNQRLEFTGSRHLRSFTDWLQKQPVGAMHFILFIRPGGAGNFDSIKSDLERVDASFGFDVISDKQSLKLRSEVTK